MRHIRSFKFGRTCYSLLLCWKLILFTDASQGFRFLCGLTSHEVLRIPPPLTWFDVLLVPKFTSTRRWKRSLKVFYKYKRPAINLSTVLFLYSHVWTPFGNTSLELYLWPTFVGLQRVTLPKTDHASRYSLRMYVLMCCYDFAWSWMHMLCLYIQIVYWALNPPMTHWKVFHRNGYSAITFYTMQFLSNCC